MQKRANYLVSRHAGIHCNNKNMTTKKQMKTSHNMIQLSNYTNKTSPTPGQEMGLSIIKQMQQ